MKEVQDRVVQFSNRYKLTNAETGEVLGTFDFDEVTGTVQQVGTEIDKELFDSIANDLAARVVSAGGELAGTIVTFSDISGTAANVASGETSATLWGKVKNWFSRLKALAFKNKVAAGDFEAGAIKNADVAADAAISQSKVSGLESALASKANDADLAAIAKSGDLADATQDATHRVVTDTEKAAWNKKQNAITGGASTIVSSDLTEGRALVSNASGKVAVSDVTATELGYLDGVKSNIQEQLDNISSGTGFVSTSPQTLTDEQKLQARKNISAAAEEQTLKNMYNLGAYDTFTDNGDGTVTVTRKTGYYKIDGNFIANHTWHEYPRLISVKIPNVEYQTDLVASIIAVSNVWNNGNPQYDYAIEDHTSSEEGNVGVRVVVKNATTEQEFRNYVSQNPIFVEYELQTSEQYTENLIAETPIHTLDKHMSDIVRDEVEKTLNLFNGSRRLADWGLRVGSAYTIYVVGNSVKISKVWDSNSSTDDVMKDIKNNPIDGAAIYTFVYNTNQEWLIFINPGINKGNENLADYQIMCCAGSHAYPYQPYNGAIVHEKQLDDALEDYLPLTGGTIDGNLNVNGLIEDAGQRVYSPNNPQTTIAEAEKIKDLSNDQMQLLINFFQNLTPFYFDEETETADVIGLNDYGKTLIDIEIPSEYHGKTVTGIAPRGNEGAFLNCTNIESVVIPSSVTSIGGYSFSGCTNLTSIDIPSSVTIIESNTFRECTSLTSITIPLGVTIIDSYAFIDCTNLASITLPQSIVEIGNGAFNDCINLTSITYQGTIAEWNSIDKKTGIGAWDKGTGSYVVHCTDGDINKS